MGSKNCSTPPWPSWPARNWCCLTSRQVVLGLIDLGAASGALFVLLPAHHGLDYFTFAAIYVFASVLGIASHAPGGIGVFDAAMLVALPQFGREDLLATLLLFRLLYFVIPFTIAITLMGIREFWMNVALPWRERRRAESALECAAEPGE